MGGNNEELARKVGVVTGASSGLGVEFAKLFAEHSANLVLVARRTGPMDQLAEALQKAQSVQVLVIGMDLSRPGAAAELKAELDARGIVIEVLVNNAGFGVYGEFLDQSVEKITEMMRLNIMTLTELTHVFGQEMANRGRGRIVLVASVLGYQAVPGYAAYAASKGYVLLLGEALHQELGTSRCVGDHRLARENGDRLWRYRRGEILAPSQGTDHETPSRGQNWRAGCHAGQSECGAWFFEQGERVHGPSHASLDATDGVRQGDGGLKESLWLRPSVATPKSDWRMNLPRSR
jgi:NADP-dependent 3-hydroxy acid dehydrogenase YdfG